MKQAQRLFQDGIHPRIITDGYEIAKQEALHFLEGFKVVPAKLDKVILLNAAKTSLFTKLHPDLANM